MRKTLSVILAIILAIGVLSGCGKQSADTKSEIINGSKSDNSKPDDSNLETFEGVITSAMPFSEGYAFVSTSEKADAFAESRRNICITENGKIAFRLPNEFDTCYAGFKNGYALVEIAEAVCIVDTKGNVVVSPQKNGYTNAIVSKQAFEDGYLPVYLESKDYTGTTYKFGVLNAKGDWIIPLTDKLFPDNQPESPDNCTEGYYDGYLHFKGYYYDYDFWWNLKDGTVANDIVTDAWRSNNDRYHDENDIVKLDLSSKSEKPNNNRGGDFEAGNKYAYFYFSTCFFTVIDRQGNFLFEPLPTKNFDTAGVNEKAKICYSLTEENKLNIYDLQGKLIQSLTPQLSENNIKRVVLYPNDNGEGYLIYEEFFNTNRTSGEKLYYVNKQGEVIIG